MLPTTVTRNDRAVTLLTVAVSMWNMGAGFLAGLVLWYIQGAGEPEGRTRDEAQRA